MKKVLITGGAGFIGSHLVEHYLSIGREVVVIDNLSTGFKANLEALFSKGGLTFYEAALQNFEGLEKVVSDCDLILHFAAAVGVKQVLKSPMMVMESNVNATQRLLGAVAGHAPDARVVLASSSEVYGLSPNIPFSEMDDLRLPSRDPIRWCYAVTKLADEMYAFSYFKEYGLNVTTVRLFNTSGKRQVGHYGMVLPNFIASAVKNQDIVVYGDGLQTRSLCDVRDTVALVSRIASNNQAAGIVVNVGNDAEISMNDLAKKVIRVTGSESKIRHIPYAEAYGQDFVDVKRRKPDLTLVKQLTGYTPVFSIDETIREIAGI